MSLFMTSINQLTTKTRTVFDTSAKNGDEKSSNECLYSGLLLTAELFGILFRFRAFNMAVVCDI